MPSPPWSPSRFAARSSGGRLGGGPSAREGIEGVVERWLASSWVKPCFCVDATLDATPGAYTSVPDSLAPEVRRALEERGIGQLYTHQAQAIRAACAGQNVVV